MRKCFTKDPIAKKKKKSICNQLFKIRSLSLLTARLNPNTLTSTCYSNKKNMVYFA